MLLKRYPISQLLSVLLFLLTLINPLTSAQDKSVLPENFRSYVPASLRARLNSIIHYTNSDAKIYSIATLPQVLGWGTASGGADDLSSYVTHGGVPLKVWFPAEVKLPWFFDDKGKLMKKASLCFLPLREADYERANIILTTFCNPQIGRHAVHSLLALQTNTML